MTKQTVAGADIIGQMMTTFMDLYNGLHSEPGNGRKVVLFTAA